MGLFQGHMFTILVGLIGMRYYLNVATGKYLRYTLLGNLLIILFPQ